MARDRNQRFTWGEGDLVKIDEDDVQPVKRTVERKVYSVEFRITVRRDGDAWRWAARTKAAQDEVFASGVSEIDDFDEMINLVTWDLLDALVKEEKDGS